MRKFLLPILLLIFSCEEPAINGCTTTTACNYNIDADKDDGSCIQPQGCNEWCPGDSLNLSGIPELDCAEVCGGANICGCNDTTALNYDSTATFNDDSCEFEDDNIMWCVYSIFEENKKPNFGRKKKDKTYVGLYHAPIMGAVTDMGFTFDDGLELEMFEGCDMVIMGDIHSRQRFDLGGIVLAYVGSFIQQNYGESIDGHGYLIWDVEKKDYEEFDISTSYGYYQFRIRNITDIDDNREVLLNG